MSAIKQPYPIELHFEIEDAKNSLRSAIRATRKSRSERVRQEAAEEFARVVLSIPEVRAAKTVGLYVSRPSEPDTGPLLELLSAMDKKILLPVLGTGLKRDWATFIDLEDLQERAPGRPPEPSSDALGEDALCQADVVIAPALAVDTRGQRLGQGGGWYDRALAFVREEVKVIALCFPEEIYDGLARPLPTEEHDLPVHAVATTTNWQWLPSVSV